MLWSFYQKVYKPEQRINLLFQLTKVGNENIKIALVMKFNSNITKACCAITSGYTEKRLNESSLLFGMF